MIDQETIERIRSVASIEEVIGDYVRLKRKGRHFEALCPFHVEKTPSFKVNTDRQIFHCFGCSKGGDLFRFLMEHERLSFGEAIRLVAQKYGITITERKSDPHREQTERLHFAHQVAIEYFQNVLKQSKYRVVRDDYLIRKRQLTEETIAQFGIGMAGEDWDGLLKAASAKGLTADDLVVAGLALRNEERKSYFDRFRLRVMIPIFSLSQKTIAFGGRTVKKGEPAKYINSPETPLYSKSAVLYGLNFARDYIRAANSVVVVEGYFDLISLWQAGIRNVVASSGTAFTGTQARLLARFCDMAYLFFDADSAGQQAALRSVDMLYDAGLDVRVMSAPPGHDPDTLARSAGKEGVEALVASAPGYITYRVHTLRADQSGIVLREKLVKELASLGSRIADPTRRSLFLTEAAAALNVSQAIMESAQTGQKTSGSVSSTPTRLAAIEREFLSLLLYNPGGLDNALESISPDDLDSRQLGRLYAAMVQQYRDSGRMDAASLITRFTDEAMVSTLSEVAAVDWPADRVEAETRAYVQALMERKRKKIRTALKQELEDAQARNDHDRANALVEQMKQFGLLDTK